MKGLTETKFYGQKSVFIPYFSIGFRDLLNMVFSLSIVSEQSWDTKEKDLTKVTFKPKAVSFEADIMDSMGIKEDRERAPNFYY